MIPNLLVGDYILASKYTYGYSKYSFPESSNQFPDRVFAAQPERGDIVVFRLPRDPRVDYIKRVIGLPGDKVQIIDGRLYLNGEIVPRTPAPAIEVENAFGQKVPVATYQEIMPGGRSYVIIQIAGDSGQLANTAIFEVPPKNYFVLGDNRDNSSDSRMPASQMGVGFVPFENLVGRAGSIYFSIDPGDAKQKPHIRWERIGAPVQ